MAHEDNKRKKPFVEFNRRKQTRRTAWLVAETKNSVPCFLNGQRSVYVNARSTVFFCAFSLCFNENVVER